MPDSTSDDPIDQEQNAEELFALSKDLMEHRDMEASLEKLRSATELDPGNPKYRESLAAALVVEGNWEGAFDEANRILPDKQDDYAFLIFHSIVSRKSGNLSAALPSALSAIKLKPDSSAGYLQLGLAFHDADETEKACACYQEAYAKSPGNPQTALFFGHSLIMLGRADEALDLFNSLPSTGPLSVHAWYGRTLSGENITSPEVIESLEATKEQLAGNIPLLVRLHFTLGKAYYKAGEYEKAFRNYTTGNVYRRGMHGDFDRDEFKKHIDATIATFTNEFFSSFPLDRGSRSEKPIFIVGMPRSGTSLVEQILASHPQVYGCGELTDLGNAAVALLQSNTPAFNTVDIERAASRYLTVIETKSNGELRVTDKMPTNFINLWLACLMFPKAHIIHCNRHPVDNCISCYICNFEKGHEYSDSLADVAFFHNQKQRLMRHWHKHLPTRILDVSYERMVEHTPKVIDELLAFCDLPPDKSCERFYETERPVRTASANQVRKRIYGSSVGRWKHYEPFLGPLMEELGAIDD